jgi:hypothetical protein
MLTHGPVKTPGDYSPMGEAILGRVVAAGNTRLVELKTGFQAEGRGVVPGNYLVLF